MCAVVSGYTDVVDELMLQPGATILLPDIEGETGTLLSLAHHHMLGTFKRRQNMVKHLLWSYKDALKRSGALHQTLAGLNPLHQAILAGDELGVKLLLEVGSDPFQLANVKAENPMRRPMEGLFVTILDTDDELRKIPMSEIFQRQGIDQPKQQQVPPEGPISCLHLAVVTRHSQSHTTFTEKVSTALENFTKSCPGKIIALTSIETIDSVSQLPMLKANTNIVKMLLSYGLKAMLEDAAEMCRAKDRGMLRLLLPTGKAREKLLSAKDAKGSSLLDIAMESEDQKIINFVNGIDEEFLLDSL